MKRSVCCLVVIAVAGALVMSCQFTATDEPTQDEIDQAVDYADEVAQDALDLFIDASITGDSDAFDAFVGSYGLGEISTELAVAPRVAAMSETGTQGAYEWVMEGAIHGDILLFTDEEGSSWTHSLMKLFLVGEYYHAGIYLDSDYMPTALGFPPGRYLLSASVRINETGIESGVLIQTIEEVTEHCAMAYRISFADPVTGEPPAAFLDPALYSGLGSIIAADTLYSFLYLNLAPVPRESNDLWYCSKVSWRAYELAGINSEYRSDLASMRPSMDLYLLPIDPSDPTSPPRWTLFRETLIVQIYYAILDRFLPARWARYIMDNKVKAVLKELITPDEVCAWGALLASVGMATVDTWVP